MRAPSVAIIFCFSLSVFISSGCSNKSDNPAPNVTPPSLTTNSATNITAFNATLGGTVTSLGNNVTILGRGVCVHTNANPTISDPSQSTGGSGLGPYSLTFPPPAGTNLTPNTTYHVRAYINYSTINSSSEFVYGNDVTFKTL